MDTSLDPITREWFLVKSWKPPIFILSLYLWFVLKAGPHFMRERKPFILKNVIVAYNFFQVVANFTLVMDMCSIVAVYSSPCRSIDTPTSPMAFEIRNWCWRYTALKFIDLFDTIFFVLRKKTNQITFLHVFHHVMITVYAEVCLTYQPGGQVVFLAGLNSTVHVFMYFYYGIAALGPKYRKYLWWKRHITELQLVQFLTILVYSGQSYFRDCEYPMWLVNIHVSVAILFLYLFGNFYHNTYLKGNKSIAEKN